MEEKSSATEKQLIIYEKLYLHLNSLEGDMLGKVLYHLPWDGEVHPNRFRLL